MIVKTKKCLDHGSILLLGFESRIKISMFLLHYFWVDRTIYDNISANRQWVDSASPPMGPEVTLQSFLTGIASLSKALDEMRKKKNVLQKYEDHDRLPLFCGFHVCVCVCSSVLWGSFYQYVTTCSFSASIFPMCFSLTKISRVF